MTLSCHCDSEHWSKPFVKEEQNGLERAEYGKTVIESLARKIKASGERGFEARNLWIMRKFYRSYPILNAVRTELAWTHYRLLLRIENDEKRRFYELECAKSKWSTRELDRQISSLLYERLALSRDKQGVMDLSQHGAEPVQSSDILKDPYVLEFLGLKPHERLLEKDLESALIEHLQLFLLELGRGFSFIARQKPITLDGDHFYIDLVFYHYILKCFVLVDLKVGKLIHQDIGQMQMYVNYYEREMTVPGDSPPIGILLCAEKNDAIVKYTLNENNKQIFAARYQLQLPTEEELRKEIIRETALIAQEKEDSV